jgi:hypothetical protein
MKKILKFIKGILIAIWVIIAIGTTMLLISYNNYSVSVIGKYSIFIVDSERLEPKYYKNDIIVVKNVAENKYEVGDNAFFYIDNASDEVFINYGEITKIEEVDHAEDAFYFGKDAVSYSRLLGPEKEVKVYHNWGLLLSILESRWGFMFFIIFPTIFAVVYEVYSIIEEVKSNDDEEDE